ncbi:MAG: hypothetical protein H6739_42405, partial [Alphaproteobacteria bacterium]|nr:hypothetical protein [Alphaproteobacteria bacterium]
MQLFPLGVDLTGAAAVPPQDAAAMSAALLQEWTDKAPALRALFQETTRAMHLRSAQEEHTAPAAHDPKVVGWTLLMAEDDPQRAEALQALKPLTDLRGRATVLPAPGPEAADWERWREAHWGAVDADPPGYVLIVGSPERVSFDFQAHLATLAMSGVGRLDLDPDGLHAYAEKLARLAEAEPREGFEAVLFAPDQGPGDATQKSHSLLAEPLARALAEVPGASVTRLLGRAATRAALVEALATQRPDMVWITGHGLVDRYGPPERARALNGAVCAMRSANDRPEDWLWTAADVPADQP